MYAINAQNNARSTECLTCALDAGELLLTYGAEVSRVEDTIQRLCLLYTSDAADD